MKTADIKIEDFSSKELLRAIIKHLREWEDKEVPLYLIADALEDGSWLNSINEKLKEEQ